MCSTVRGKWLRGVPAMCDCYETKCKICGIGHIPIHLKDWDTDRNEIEVYCMGHIPKENVRVFTFLGIFPKLSMRKRYRVGIRALTENAIKNKNGNFPNVGFDCEVEDFIVKETEYKVTFSIYSKDTHELLEVILPRMIHMLDEFPHAEYDIGELLGREIPETQTKLIE